VRAVLQRVTRAEVRVAGDLIGEVGQGYLILVCAMAGDTEAVAAKLAAKVAKLRVFKDDQGKMNLSVKDIGGVHRSAPRSGGTALPPFQHLSAGRRRAGGEWPVRGGHGGQPDQ